MKPGRPLQRHKPLVGNPETHRAWQDRTRDTAILRRRSTFLERTPQFRTRPRDTGPDRSTRDRLSERSGMRCELCGRLLPPGTRQAHHRQPRGIGGTSDPASNELSVLLDLCDECHCRVERDRLWAKQRGLLVPRPTIPAGVPVQLRYAPVPVYLDDLGDWSITYPRGTAA